MNHAYGPGDISRKHLLAAGVSAAALPLALGTRVSAQAAAIRIGTTLNEGSGPVFYAADQGFFRKAGLDAEVIVLQNGAAVGAALAGGSLDVGTSSTFVFMNAFRHNLPYSIVAPGSLYRSDDPTTLLVVSANSPITSARDLNGKIVAGISLGATDQVAALKWIDQNGGDSKTIEFLESAPSTMVAGLESGRFAAAMLVDPQLTAAGTRVRSLGKAYDAIAKNFMLSVWFANNDWVSKNVDRVKRLNSALNEAAAWALASPEGAAASLEKWTKVTVQRTRMRYANRLDPSLIQPVCDAAFKYKVIETPLDARSFFWTARK